MGVRQYRPRDDSTSDKMDIKRDRARQEATEFILPRIIERNKSAMDVVPVPFFFYQRIPHGRRCACWGINDSPLSDCTVCFGQGIVGGFEKFGCSTEVFDTTFPKVHGLNSLPSFAENAAQPKFTLADTAVYGELITTIPIRQPNRGLDLLWARMIEGQGSSVELLCKTPSELTFVPLSIETVSERISSSFLTIKCILKRQTPEASLPGLEQVRIRVRIAPEENLIVKANIPREEESYALEDFAIIDSFGSINFWLDNTLRRITTEDFFVSIRNSRRFKPVFVQPNDPHGHILSWDCSCRYIQSYEPYMRVP